MIKKKGDVWVSAVLYIALGMIIITLILSAGIPLIEKMRDKNTIVQTKRLLFNLNSNIETVANEGIGSTRHISPFEISSGSLDIKYPDNPRIIWTMTTKNLMMEPNSPQRTPEEELPSPSNAGTLKTFSEGALTMWMVETAVEGEYHIYIMLEYPNYRFDYVSKSGVKPPLVGKYILDVKHEPATGDRPTIGIEVN